MEFVYVVKRSDLFELSTPHGFTSGADGRLARWTATIRARGFFLERRQAERDSSFKQIIPYTLVTHRGEVLLMRRLPRGGEARLHGKLSVGVGGHINPVDLQAGGAEGGPKGGTRSGSSAGLDVLDMGCRRELEEEIHIRGPYTLEAVGAINDDSSDVGSVHFGLVNVARCETPEVAIRETDMLEGSFVSMAALAEQARVERERFETWSALIIDRLGELRL
jgi:predicted NUDIX family phosphoesterase